MTDFQFSFEYSGNGLNLFLKKEIPGGLFKKASSSYVDVDSWLSDSHLNIISAIARLETLSDDPEDESHRLNNKQGYFVSAYGISDLTEAQAKSLSLPATIPYQLRLSMTGPMIKPDTRINATWHKRSGQRVTVSEKGPLGLAEGQTYRIPGDLYRLLEAVDEVNDWNGDFIDDRLTLIASLKSHLSQIIGIDVDIERQLDDIHLMHASTVSLDVNISDRGVWFDPVLFSRQTIEDSGEDVVQEDDQLVSEDLQNSFRSQFKESETVKGSYVLTRNQYLFIDPALRPALAVVHKAQRSTPEERHRFAKSPQSFIKAALTDAGIEDETADEIVNASFVETDKFSDRVLEIGVWIPPVLPFIKTKPNTWIPEGFGLKIGTENFTIPEASIRPLAERVVRAIQDGESHVPIPNSDAELPVSTQALQAINVLLEQALHQPPVDITPPEDAPEEDVDDDIDIPVRPGKTVLRVQNNFTEAGFVAKFEERAEFSGFETPEGFLNEPKNHQIEGIAWLQECWANGFPGALLADDMGLGKTFQTLGFMSWLGAKRRSLGLPRSPVLIVAPTSLLGNWEKEANIHIHPDQVGEMTLLYGSHLRKLRLPGFNTNDVVAGQATLDTKALFDTDWVLTTYETMRDHHISLARIQFSCVVFDEMQKIKNPKSMMTNSAQALNGDFTIGLTGTPIENSLADLWTLFDTLMPGAMGWGDLKQFLNFYTTEHEDRLKALKERLQVGHDGNPPTMLRRMKSEVAKDLPAKLEKVIDGVMPEQQALLYQQAVALSQQSESGKDKQKAFQQIRGVSLHPFYPDSEEAANGDDYVSMSARLRATIEILDEVHKSNEKALVFIESRAMHEWLSYYLKERYGMAEKPARIFGAVTSIERSKIVERFQSDENVGKFDLLLLSPKAAGVGLTLTAATHVIHLSRWWNPAVEDQCTDRAYRIGQSKDVTVYVPRAIHPLYGQGSFDCILHDLLENKRALSSEMLIPLETGDELDQIFSAMFTTDTKTDAN